MNHETMIRTGNQVIYFEMAFPPAEKDLDFPAKEIDSGNLFGGKVPSVGCDPVRFHANAIPDDPEWCVCGIDF